MDSQICEISFVLPKHIPLKIKPCKKSVLHFTPLNNNKRAKLGGGVERKELAVKKSGKK